MATQYEYENERPRVNGAGQKRNGQRPAQRPYENGGRRPPQKRKKKSSAGMVVLVIVLIIILAAVAGFAAVTMGILNIDGFGTPAATLAPTAAPTSTVSHSEQLNALVGESTPAPQTEQTMTATNLAAMLGDDDSEIEGLSAEQMTVVTDLAVNPNLPSEWLNILLLGSDERNVTESARTDSMIICSINTSTGEVKLTSIMRDLAVYFDEIGEYTGTYRINAANYFGGEELAMRVVNECFNLNIENYVRVNFYGFQQIAHMMGGIEVDITEEEMNLINERIVEQAHFAKWNGVDESNLPNEVLTSFGPGTHLDGRQTLAYARIRKLEGGDYARSERQRTVLTALMNKAQTLGSAELLGIGTVAINHVATNLSLEQILTVAMSVIEHGITSVESYRLPVNGSYVQETRNDESMFYDCDWNTNASELYNFIYG